MLKLDTIARGMGIETAAKALHDPKHANRREALRQALTLAVPKLRSLAKDAFYLGRVDRDGDRWRELGSRFLREAQAAQESLERVQLGDFMPKGIREAVAAS